MDQRPFGVILLTLVCSNLIIHTLANPDMFNPNQRRFVAKPNDIKKQEILYGAASSGGASAPSPSPVRHDAGPIGLGEKPPTSFWGNLLAIAMQFASAFLQPDGGFGGGVDKIDNNELGGGVPEFSWPQLISMGIRLLLMGLGADSGVDKVDSGNSALQSMLTAVLTMAMGNEDPNEVAYMAKQTGELINLVVTLLDALKTSFSERALSARSMGGTALFPNVGIGLISVAKGYTRTWGTENEACVQKFMCEANKECASETENVSYLSCTVGTYFSSLLIEKQRATSLASLTEAGRRGRLNESCEEHYIQCNEV